MSDGATATALPGLLWSVSRTMLASKFSEVLFMKRATWFQQAPVAEMCKEPAQSLLADKIGFAGELVLQCNTNPLLSASCAGSPRKPVNGRLAVAKG